MHVDAMIISTQRIIFASHVEKTYNLGHCVEERVFFLSIKFSSLFAR